MREPRSRTLEPPYREEGALLSGIPGTGTYDAYRLEGWAATARAFIASTPRIAASGREPRKLACAARLL